LLGYFGMTLPWTELGITLSVLVLGLCISFPHFLPSLPLLAILSLFALCHGFAHGSEMPMGMPVQHYVIGFVMTTAILHLLGIIMGNALIPRSKWILRTSGFAMAIATVFL
jgi:urease accessory protein